MNADDDLFNFEGVDFEALEDDDELIELTEEQVAEWLRKNKLKGLDPIPYDRKITKKEIAVVDTETDPFSPDLIVKPFTLGFRTADRYVDFWGDDCIDQFFAYLATLDTEYIIYAHNGGKFDFYFFLKYLDVNHSPMIMNSRLVKIYFQGQEFRDSFAIIPEALGNYQKDSIDYNLFVRSKRERHKAKIRLYQQHDCDYLYDLVIAFHARFGDKLTIASASFAMLRSFYGFQQFYSPTVDDQFRNYYFGGRNQCFETGVLYPSPGKKWMLVDRNSMYPSVMRDELHPISNSYELQEDINDDTDFAYIIAHNQGALPQRLPTGGLDFNVKYGAFFATIHEIRAGLETGTLQIERVRHAWKFEHKATFAEFINTYYTSRLEAKAQGDKIRDLFDKRVMNSSYGKFALNPRKFKQWVLTLGEIPEPLASIENPEGWSLDTQSGDFFIWSRPTPRKKGFYNVATAASITGAARANLLRNIALSTRPIYCDTDSIICEEFRGDIDDNVLGGWKIEAVGDRAAIAGKKLYTVFNGSDVLKRASKGVNLSPAEILEVCDGREVLYKNPVPKFNLDGSATFISRRINMTGRK